MTVQVLAKRVTVEVAQATDALRKAEKKQNRIQRRQRKARADCQSAEDDLVRSMCLHVRRKWGGVVFSHRADSTTIMQTEKTYLTFMS